MRTAALYFSHAIHNPEDYDLLFITDLISVTDLKALWGSRCPPIMLYVHENQLCYPLAEGVKFQLDLALTDILSASVADTVVFNSEFQKSHYLKMLPKFLERMPECIPHWLPEKINSKSVVLPPGCRLPEINTKVRFQNNNPPLVIWNHRWQYDKQPGKFIAALEAVKAAGVNFRVAFLGENFEQEPSEFIAARKSLGDRVIQFGYVTDRDEYWRILAQGSVVVSTAIQENFGIAVVEAIWAGNYPLLPFRLAYPEVIPEKFHSECLYQNEKDLEIKLISALEKAPFVQPTRFAKEIWYYSWSNLTSHYDNLFERTRKA